MKQSLFLLLLSLAGLATTKYALAEGEQLFNGAHGVNRVIRTPAGYRAVYGHYDLEFKMPTNEDGLFETLAQRNAVVGGSQASQLIDPLLIIVNKPSVYMGGEFVGANGTSSQIDGGLQLEIRTIRSDSSTYSDPGWSVFFYVDSASFINAAGNPESYSFTRADGTNTHRIELNPRVIDSAHPTSTGVPWRGGLGKISGNMEMEATAGGRGRFKCGSLPGTGELWVTRSRPLTGDAIHPIPEYWKVSTTLSENVAPRKIDSAAYEQGSSALIIFDTSRYENSANVKRVTAMTRDGNHKSDLDGSWLKATWGSCEVFKTTPHAAPVGRKIWEVGDVNPDATGYDAPGGTVDLAFDRRYKGHRTIYSRTIIEFASIEVPVAGGTATKSNEVLRGAIGAPSRYQEETVTVNLGTIARPVGDVLQ